MKHQITLKEIAKELGLSVSTVSKSLKNYSEISSDTKEKVQAFAKLYNYKPNYIALNLKNRRSHTIGVILPEVVHYFFSSVIKGIENVANSRGYTVIISVSNEELEKEANGLRKLSNGTVDGFILSLSEDTLHEENYDHIKEAVELELPVVMFDRITDKINCDKIIVDDKQIAFDTVNYLIQKGHQKIGFLTTEDYLSVGKLRTDGYYEALQKNNLPIDESLVVRIHTQSDYQEKIEPLIKNKHIDALVTVNESFAATGIKVLNQFGYKSPEDISIISLSDGIVSKYTSPNITAINQNGFLMGQKSASLLIDRIEDLNNSEYTTTYIETNLIERESVKDRRISNN